MAPVLDKTFESLNRLADRGYAFAVDDKGGQKRISV